MSESTSRQDESGKPEKKGPSAAVIIGGIIIVGIILLCVVAVVVVAVLALLGPAIGNTFSTIIQEVGTPTP